MEENLDIFLLWEIQETVVREHGRNRADIRPYAQQVGLDIDSVMREVSEICRSKPTYKVPPYRVGHHVECTVANVLPPYEKNGTLVLDKDHIEGLHRILSVGRGLINDY